MTKLLLKGDRNEEIALGVDAVTIGRRPENQLVLADVAASGRHARIVLEQGQYFVEDLKSSNGTLVNGNRITRHALCHGDTITIGRQTMEFVDGANLLGTLVMMAPPAPQKPAAAPPADGLPKFIVPAAPAADDPATTPPTRLLPAMGPMPAPAPADTPPGELDVLDQLVGSIRSHRDREKAEREQQQAHVRAEWEKTIRYADQLKQKIGRDSRVKYFGVSRAANDVMIRFQRDPKSPMEFIMLSLFHPDQKNHVLTGLWVRRSGSADRCFPDAHSVAGELVREIAFLLA